MLFSCDISSDEVDRSNIYALFYLYYMDVPGYF